MDVSKINIFFAYNAEESIVLTKVDKDIITMMNKCLDALKHNFNCTVSDYKFDMRNTCEMSASLFYKMEDIPNVLKDTVNGKVNLTDAPCSIIVTFIFQDTQNLYLEILKAFFGLSQYSLHALFFHFIERHNIFVCRSKYDHYREKARLLKNNFIVNCNCNFN